ncbi:hypothetical protein FNF29_00266 [Cafeteria roenbergensis]|uniref:Uncharacterized protein n=1 Tax=Cafeteria roenbergensis TaxID=33653 RepID=A0A5A8D123_CAFRO|nr:hypothetical protein FNF29_00266 [Cafeteria roenbergensis]|eukprot:KAA0157691.1 hypothetical protein FNF29_00266 [Cafeteria roenbergensis]
MDTDEVQVLLSIFAIFMSAYSLASMLLAYFALEANVSDASNSLSNWQRKPLVDVHAFYAEAPLMGVNLCPRSHPELLSALYWGGVAAGPCACPAGAYAKVYGNGPYPMESSPQKCNGSQLNGGCRNDRPLEFDFLPVWTEQTVICGKRGGEPLIQEVSPFKSRPTPSATGECPDGYRLCGDPSSLSEAICFPESEPQCPYTQLLSVAKSDYNASAFPNATLVSSGDQWLVWSRNPGSLPVVDFTVGFRTLCIGEENAYTYGESPGNLEGKLVVDTQCLGGRPSDDRYVALVSAPQLGVLASNFDNAAYYCSREGRQTPALSDFDERCNAGDTICSTVTSRSRCDKLTSYKTGDPSAGDLSMLYRLQVAWSRACPVPIEELVANIGPLLEIVSFTFIVLIINGASNTISILLEGNFIVSKCRGDSPCCPLEGEAEANLIKCCKTFVGLFVKLARFVPIAILAFRTYAVREFWLSVAGLSCSDSVTSTTMELLADKFTFAFASYTGTLIVDAVSVLISVLGFVRRRCCKSSDE